MLSLWKPVALFLTLAFALSAFPQIKTSNRIQQAIDDRETVELQGNVRPTLHAAVDQGRMDGARRLQISMAFKRTAEQEATLEKLLAEQQDPASPNYHKWLTPEEFAERFGLSSSDLAAVTSWLQSQGFTVERVARAHTQVWFSGPISKIETVFRTEMHHFQLNGEAHFANSTELAVPAAMSHVVLGFSNLDDFRPRARVKTHQVAAVAHFTSNLTGLHFLIPGDFATIYDLTPLYTAGIDGTGQNLVVVGQTALVTNSSGAFTDIDAFRAAAGLPPRTATNFVVKQVPNSGASTVVSGDIGEASLDLEWSGGVAKGVNQIYVYTGNNANFTVFDSLQDAIDNDRAPVISISYGNCEQALGAANVRIFQGWAQQANAQGQTISAASGDFGVADCDTSSKLPAQGGIAVDVPAALPYVTGVGGTEFTGDASATATSCPGGTQGYGPTTYWSGSCSLTSGASALMYIPEVSWNDTVQANKLSASGGGASALFSKPSWQTGTGVPSDGARDVPDVSFAGSPDHDAYLLCATDSAASPPTLPCTNGFRDTSNNFNAAGGTSFGAPAFAGVVAIINQKTGSTGQGNVNPTLYALAASTPSAFHDITSGSNIVTCGQGTTNCPTAAPFQYGFSAGAGYDQVTGLGTIDVANLVNAWSSANPTAADYHMFGQVATISAPGGQATSTITVDARNGFSGTVTLACTAPATALITCSMSPTSVTVGGGTNSATSTLTIMTTAKASLEPQGIPFWLTGSGGLVAGVFMLGISSRQRRLRVAMTLVVLAFVMAAVGCGGGSHSSGGSAGTPAGSYVVSVTGASGSTSHTTNVSVVVL